MIGRNDKCHCGSGKKYKKCHLRADEAAGRTRKPVREADDMLVAINTLCEMLAPGGVLGTLRFDEQAFAALRGTGEFDELLAAAYPQLLKTDWLDRADRALEAAAGKKLRGAEERALALAIETLRIGADTDDPVAPPLAMATFKVQLTAAMGDSS